MNSSEPLTLTSGGHTFVRSCLPLTCPPTPPALPTLCPSTPHALPILMPSHSSCPPTLHALPILMPSHSSCPPIPPALPLLLPSQSSCPPTSFAFLCPPYLGGHGRAKGVGGQENWEGKRGGRAGGQDKYKLLEGRIRASRHGY